MTNPAPERRRLSNRQSLQLPPQPLDAPIPPSLLQSHYLNSPESIFQRSVSASHIPSEEDEQWLQDTVPLALDPQDKESKRGRARASPLSTQSTSSESSDNSRNYSPRMQSMAPRSSSSHAPSSPPLIRCRRPTHLAPQAWSGQPRVRSAPCMDEREYFVEP
ncbi:hypothetical protein FPV67DRAFT_1673138 [Lyophyllum atratum]|nr:hypothetical protein FPV67DRAFT_1673138 [Lyophyllum atratum]